MYSSDVLIVLILWVKAWYLLFACAVIELEKIVSDQNPKAINKIVYLNNMIIILSFLTYFDFESLLSHSHTWLANIYYTLVVAEVNSYPFSHSFNLLSTLMLFLHCMINILRQKKFFFVEFMNPLPFFIKQSINQSFFWRKLYLISLFLLH